MDAWITIAVFTVPGMLYATAWICSKAYFHAKLAYQRRLIRDLTKGD